MSARAEAGRLQEICIERFPANESNYLKEVQNSIGTCEKGGRHIGRVSTR
jgi:hypothetical protein